MAEYNFELQQAKAIALAAGSDYVKTQVFKNTFGNVNDYLGKQIQTELKLILPSYQIEEYNISTKSYTKKEVSGTEIILDTVLIDVRRSKVIVETSINGMNGTVAEYISNGDFEITISGALVSKNKSFPEAELKKLLKIIDAPVAIKVESEYLSFFNISEIRISSESYQQREGLYNTQLFSFSAKSNTPLELKL